MRPGIASLKKVTIIDVLGWIHVLQTIVYVYLYHEKQSENIYILKVARVIGTYYHCRS